MSAETRRKYKLLRIDLEHIFNTKTVPSRATDAEVSKSVQ
jgi:hypothetical protein